MWDFAGGKHDIGEVAKNAVIREVKEETNYNIDVDENFSSQEYKNNKYNFLFHYFKPIKISGELKLSSDHSGYMWVSIEEIRNYDLHSCVKLYFKF